MTKQRVSENESELCGTGTKVGERKENGTLHLYLIKGTFG